MEFEWDLKKANANRRRHGVSFEEAAMVLSDILSFTYDDEAHSQTERRYATLGVSNRGRLLVIAHTTRGERVRIISAPKPHRLKENGMKKKTNKTTEDDDLLPEYDFSKMKLVGRGIYAKRFRSGTNLVRLDRDVRAAFPDDELINETLRTIAKIAKQRASAEKPQKRPRKQASRSRRAA
jgi:uncharacterized DUF497 family protein